MKAEQMFENLGWKKKEDEASFIIYERGYRTIGFIRDDDSGIVTSSGHINMNVLKAINMQCKELGWI